MYRDEADVNDGIAVPLYQSDQGADIDETVQGRRRDLEVAPVRVRLTAHLESVGATRPSRPPRTVRR